VALKAFFPGCRLAIAYGKSVARWQVGGLLNFAPEFIAGTLSHAQFLPQLLWITL
jgi:hypothetical protein